MLGVMERSAHFQDLKSQISDFKSRCESISRQIRGWANRLQNSAIPGQRHLNDQSRRAYENRQRRRDSQLRVRCRVRWMVAENGGTVAKLGNLQIAEI
jgi:hypothetical protein